MAQILFVLEPLHGPAAAERDAAREWLAATGLEVHEVAPKDLAAALPSARVLWWHGPARPAAPADAERIQEWIGKGGAALLTLQAAALVQDLGIEATPPNRVGASPWKHPEGELQALEGERRGLFPYFSHPIFEGLTGGALLLEPREGRSYPEAVYADGAWPEKGQVVARELVYLDLDPTRIPVWEYAHGRGAVLCIGAHLLFAERPNRFRRSLETFARNALLYLCDRRYALRGARHWPKPEARVSSFRFEEEERPIARAQARFADPTPALVSRRKEDEFFDVAGREIRVLGRERSGVAEVWAGALRCLNGRRVRFYPAGGGKPVEEAEAFVEHRVRPFSAERVFRVGSAVVVERIAPEGAGPAVVFDWRLESGSIEGIEIEADFDHRLFWPMREGAAGALFHGWSEASRAFAVRDGEDRFAVALGFDRAPAEAPRIEDRSEGGVPRLRLRARFGATGPAGLRAILAGSDEGHLDALEVMRAAEARGERVFAAAAEQAKRFFGGGFTLETPDRGFDESFAWTAAKLAPFVADYPRIGRALAAGFMTTRPGWNSGRPGYDWFFGRDTCWCSGALLALGLHEAVLGALEALIRLQDPSGKILHEATPSGAVHYDAADSTPLFLIAVDRYLRSSGDLPFAERHRTAIVRALEFCFSTDTDGDGLIENTGVGHGWVEGGPLYGKAHATFYLNSCWAEALRSSARIARALGEELLASRCDRAFERVRASLNEKFFDPERHRFFFALRRDGKFDDVPTIEPAVGALFGLLDPERIEPFLEEVAGSRYSAPWGVRFIPKDHPSYDPRGYHNGTVWPLFTGWVALAEYRHHRAEAALAHVRASLGNFRKGALGCVAEVLNGDRDEPAGVCPHQAWSHALTLSPVFEGLLGLEANALESTLAIAPHLPREWPRLSMKRFALGDHELDLLLERKGAGLRVLLEHRGPKPLGVILSPAFPGIVELERALVDGKRAGLAVERNDRDQHAKVRIDLDRRAEVLFEASGDRR